MYFDMTQNNGLDHARGFDRCRPRAVRERHPRDLCSAPVQISVEEPLLSGDSRYDSKFPWRPTSSSTANALRIGRNLVLLQWNGGQQTEIHVSRTCPGEPYVPARRPLTERIPPKARPLDRCSYVLTEEDQGYDQHDRQHDGNARIAHMDRPCARYQHETFTLGGEPDSPAENQRRPVDDHGHRGQIPSSPGRRGHSLESMGFR